MLLANSISNTLSKIKNFSRYCERTNNFSFAPSPLYTSQNHTTHYDFAHHSFKYQFICNNFFCSTSNVVHTTYPFKLILPFQFLGDALCLTHLFLS